MHFKLFHQCRDAGIWKKLCPPGWNMVDWSAKNWGCQWVIPSTPGFGIPAMHNWNQHFEKPLETHLRKKYKLLNCVNSCQGILGCEFLRITMAGVSKFDQKKISNWLFCFQMLNPNVLYLLIRFFQWLKFKNA